MSKNEKDIFDHFAQPENGSLQFSVNALRRQWKQWKTLKYSARGQQVVFKKTPSDAEWVQVFAFMDKHPGYTKEMVVQHFTSQGIKFKRDLLSVKHRECDEIKSRVATAAEILKMLGNSQVTPGVAAAQRER